MGTNTKTILRPQTTQKLTVSGTTAVIANGVGDGVKTVRLLLDGASASAFVKVGTAPTAVAATDMPIANGVELIIQITKGDKVAAIGTDGILYVTEMV